MGTDAGTVLAIVPARGGSKGLPGKNIRPFGGIPLLAWSIRAAADASTVDRVVVSTDDADIAAIARDAGAEVPFRRPPELAADGTTDLPVFLHVLDVLDGGGDVDIVVHLRPTSPLRQASMIDDAVRALRDHPDVDSLRSVSRPDKTPYKMWRTEDGLLEPLLGSWDDELFNQPRQNLPEAWVHDGVLDVVRASVLLGGSICGRRIMPIYTPEGDAVDIDDLVGFERAERLLAERLQASGPEVTSD